MTENIKMALKSLCSNKMRTFLTMLGIIIGICSVIMIISVGEGGKQSIMGRFNQIGAASLQLRVNTQDAAVSDYMNLDDVDAIRDRLPYVKYATPVMEKRGSASANNITNDADVFCTNEDYAPLYGFTFVSGRYFNRQECETDRAVAVIDETTARKFFGTDDVQGCYLNVTVKTVRYKVKIVGVVKDESGIFGGMKDMPSQIYIPASIVLANADSNDISSKISSIIVMADSKDDTDTAGNAAISLLGSRHGNSGRELYSFEDLLKQIDQINSVIGIFTGFISAVAAISLIVGGIGVMNIMLVSVTERTREIGIRKSLGARTSVILMQFLTESVIITFMGGVAGIALGVLGGRIIGAVVGVTPVLSPGSFAVAILFSCAVGMFFGIYPARKAAKLNPIEALRHD